MRPRLRPAIFTTCAVVFLCSIADAAVVGFEVSSRADANTPGYEEIVGKLRYEIDPKHPGNAVIADVDLAPVNAAGRVSFSSDIRIWKPKDAGRSNGVAWFEIPNRGGKASINPWFIREGFTVVSVGWEFDAPAGGEKLRAEVPRARSADGRAIRGVVSATFTPDKRLDEQTLTDLEEYPPVGTAGPDSRLIMRTRAAYPGGRALPRETWTLEGKKLRLRGGFVPGTTYELSYLAEAPPVAGLGYAAIRDAVAWLKHAPDSPAPVKHACALGSSQCGRLLRDFLYLGFNTDEQDRPALDGVIAHIAGAGRLVLNQRWATPRSTAGFYTASYPFADSRQTDPVSGHSDGVLENPPRVKHAPKIFYINTSSEYWGAGRVAALTHTDPAGAKDIEFPPNVRSYYYAGTQHGPAGFPPTAQAAEAPLANPVNASSVTVALRMALHRWVTTGVEPPPSVYPRLRDGTLGAVKDVRFPKVPGMGDPRAITAGERLPNPRWPDGAGAGTELPLLVPEDADGNDLVGIRMPDVAVPLGTATGWVFRPEALGSPHELVLLRGAWVPFAATKGQREAMRDPRLSLEERYDSKDAYLAKVEGVLKQLIRDGFLTNEDLTPQLQQASERWDWVVKQSAP